MELGPGILSNIFDGIQRPLETIAKKYDQIFVPKGVELPCLDIVKKWDFIPNESLKVGSVISGGDVLGSVFENNLFDEHRILLPPKAKGRVTYIAEPGNYNIREKVIEVEFGNKK